MARSQRKLTRSARIGRARSAARGARRVWPYVLMAWERWQSLSDEDKERYKKQVREYANRGRAALDAAQAQRKGRPPGRRYPPVGTSLRGKTEPPWVANPHAQTPGGRIFRSARQRDAGPVFEKPNILLTSPVTYIESSIRPGVTIDEYRRSRPGKPSRRCGANANSTSLRVKRG